MRNEANLSIADWGQTCSGTPAPDPAALDPREPIVRNKPNCPAGSGKGKYLAKKEL